MKANIYIIDYTDGIRTVHGPYKETHVFAIHTTVPHVQPDMISFYVTNEEDSTSVLTVSMVHVITDAANIDNV